MQIIFTFNRAKLEVPKSRKKYDDEAFKKDLRNFTSEGLAQYADEVDVK